MGQRVAIRRVRDEDASALKHLQDHGLLPGSRLTVKEVRAIDGLVTVEDEEGNLHPLGPPVARSIFVRVPSGDDD